MGVIVSMVECLLKAVAEFLTTSHALVFLAVLLLTKYFILVRRHPRMPPGPWGLPFVGYLPYLGKSMHETLDALSKVYGPVFQFSLGVKRVVILSDPEIVRQTFKREELTGRPTNKLYDMFQGYGVVNIAGDKWREQRRFLHEHMRALGVKTCGPDRRNMEASIKVEVRNLLEALAGYEGKDMNADIYLKNASANVVCNMLMSVTFQKDNPNFQRFMTLHKQGFQLFMKADIANYVPFFKYLPSVKSCMKQLADNRQESMTMLKEFVNERRQNFDPTRSRDIIDAYLQQEHKAKLEGAPIDESYDCQLLQVMCDLFSAGQETVNLALNWCLIYLLHNKDVTSKVQSELDTVVGRTRLPSLEDMSSLPYTEATICEVLRRSNIIPLGTPHCTTQDTQIGGYFIPGGTTVFSSLYSCHMDPKIWPCPETFDPQRFLDDEGKLSKPKGFMPFGVGRRMCLGDVLAKSEIFLLISSILHVFKLDFARTDQPVLKGISFISTSPEAYKIRFIPRDTSTPSPHESLSSRSTRGV